MREGGPGAQWLRDVVTEPVDLLGLHSSYWLHCAKFLMIVPDAEFSNSTHLLLPIADACSTWHVRSYRTPHLDRAMPPHTGCGWQLLEALLVKQERIPLAIFLKPGYCARSLT